MMVEKSFEVWEKRQSAARLLDGNAVSASVVIQIEKRTATMFNSSDPLHNVFCLTPQLPHKDSKTWLALLDRDLGK
jgi:hypothetical protein